MNQGMGYGGGFRQGGACCPAPIVPMAAPVAPYGVGPGVGAGVGVGVGVAIIAVVILILIALGVIF